MVAKAATEAAYRLLHDGSIALSQVEAAGFRVDTTRLAANIADTDKQIKETEALLRKDPVHRLWVRRFGDRTNLGSREQLGTIIFGKEKDGKIVEKGLGYTRQPGVRANDEAAFDHIEDLPFLDNYLSLEKLKRARTTFLGGIDREVVDGYLHPNYNLNIPQTYRSSADNPNSQNWPIRNPEIAKLIRSNFIARDGHVLVEIDFSGVEVRVAACYHKDPTMLSYINDPTKDMHRDMAMQIFKLPIDQVTKEIRHLAKNRFVFPEFYGSDYISCAPALWKGVNLTTASGMLLRDHLADQGFESLGECDRKQDPRPGTFEKHIKAIDKHFWQTRFPVYTKWKRQWFDQYLDRGWFEMKTGFVVHALHSRNDVINYPVQGSAFHCLLWSLIKLVNWLNKHKMRSCIVGQIHDSIIADVHIDELEDFLHTAHHVMTVMLRKAWKWIITPIEVEMEAAPEGGSWYDKKKVTI